MGQVSAHTFADGVGTDRSYVTTSFDPDRGLPEALSWTPPGGSAEDVATLVRGSSGAARSRLSGLGNCLERSWTRDHLGRVVQDTVENDCGPQGGRGRSSKIQT